MADTKISAMTAASALSGPELFAGVQGGANVKITATQVQTFIGSGLTIGSTTITSGTDTRVLFQDGTVVGESAGFTFTKGNDGTTSILGIGGNANLLGEAANALALRNSTNAQTFNVYETYTDGSNYRRLAFSMSSGTGTIRPQGAGTGTNDLNMIVASGTGSSLLYFETSGTLRWSINTNGHLLAVTDNTYDIGASGATRPKNIYAAGNITAELSVGGRSSLATPAVAAAVPAFTMGSALVGIYFATGDPNTVVTAPKGSILIRTDGSGVANRMYINTDASTAWTAFATAG